MKAVIVWAIVAHMVPTALEMLLVILCLAYYKTGLSNSRNFLWKSGLYKSTRAV